VNMQSILEAISNSRLIRLPYDVLNSLRAQHSIDLTGFNLSMTMRGNMYRSYALMRGT